MPIFFFNDTATTEIYTLSLHDALPILSDPDEPASFDTSVAWDFLEHLIEHATWKSQATDRKSTRLNSSHQIISYSVFCLKKKISPTNASLCHRNVSCCRIFNWLTTTNQ